ncbi:hypothetical protein C3920_10715, partial [Novacetimonas pomaceti]
MDQPKAAPTHEATSPSASPDAESWGSIPTLGRFAHLDRVRYPHDLRNLSVEQLKALADELRAETIDTVSTTSGHLG